jgi:hypothetical protein
LGIAIIASQGLLAAASRLARRKRLRLGAAWAAGAMLFLVVWGAPFRTQLMERDQRRQNVIESYYPAGIRPGHVLSAVGDIYFGAIGRDGPPALRASLVAAVSLAGFGLILRRKAARRRAFPLARPIVLWAFWGALVLDVAICLIRPVFLARYLTMCAPLAALFLAAALARMPKKYGLPLLALLLLGSLAGYRSYLGAMPREDWRGAAQALLAGMKPTDAIVTENVKARSCLAYYCQMLGRPELARNIFTFEQFDQRTRGRYPHVDRTLWFLDSRPQSQAQQRQLLHAANAATGRMALGAGFVLETFHGMGGAH